MTKTITIDPVTRIEGHAKITIHLDDNGQVEDARFHVTEFRGFEKFCEGRSFWEMPGITARICGICPVSHLMASSKAGDAILGVNIPPTAAKLRRLMNWAQLVQSHALSFFHLSGPDLLLGMDSDPTKRNVMGLIDKFPDVARNGIRLRRFGQKVIEMLGGRSVHPAWTVAGGVREPLSDENRSKIRRMLPEALDITGLALDMLRDATDSFRDEEAMYGNFPSLYMGLVTPEGGLEHYDGLLRVVDSDGNVLEKGLAPARYREILGEAVEPWSYLKFPYYRPAAVREARGGRATEHYIAGMYRVGPLARLNVCDFAGTPRADAELREFRRLAPRGRPVANSFHYHYARLIEILYALERIAETVEDPSITEKRIRAHAEVNNMVGVGVSEAPRGTLFHEYHVNGDGILQKVNLIIATGQNNLAMNRTVKQIAQYHINDGKVSEGILNRIEHGIRLYDPCLSCSTHAVGQMPMVVEVYNAAGALVERVQRD
ncbi:MAG: NADP oxidoreductase [Chloroflexota bacterium]|nr:Ni/Fe hydrogenase subunit alpha [Caldilinea sp.]GIK72863.1 MAG: NADP oxidoreductase [Chloroflexota bacterium]